ncbi:MAG: hypothetical protein PVG49_09470 [Desulfobacteraceae bacterium]|jgi:hypothetical protein
MKPVEGEGPITPQMTVLDVVGRFRQTEAVFRKYDEKAGVCICCQALFDPLEQVARDYALDLNRLVQDLERAIEPPEGADSNP